jgi:C4-type Zn-finger protein
MTNTPTSDRLDRIEQILERIAIQQETNIQQIEANTRQIEANTQQIAANAEGISELRLLLRDYFSRSGNGDRPPTT